MIWAGCLRQGQNVLATSLITWYVSQELLQLQTGMFMKTIPRVQ
jgi:hypothetical protein